MYLSGKAKLTEELFKVLHTQASVTDGKLILKLPIWRLIELSLPHIKKLTQQGLTINDLEGKIDMILEGPNTFLNQAEQ